jgi:hypothetical protein
LLPLIASFGASCLSGSAETGNQARNPKEGTEMTHGAIGKRCIVRTYASGVHLGTVESVENNGQFSRCTLKNARRIRYWRGDAAHIARSLSEVAINGIATEKSQVHVNVPEHFIEDAIEFIPATEAAIASIEAATNDAK